MRSKLGVFILSFIFIFTFLLSSTQVADAAVKEHEKRGVIPMYNPNGGGILASIVLIVNTSIIYTPTTISNPDYNMVQFGVRASTLKSSFIQCGGTMNVVSPVKMGSTNISLIQDTDAYWGDGNYTYDRKKSTNVGRLKGAYTIESTGQFYPSPSSCIGGGKVTSSFSFSNY